MSIGQNLAVYWGRYEYTHNYKDQISLCLYHNRLSKVLIRAENMDILEYLNFKVVISGLKNSLEIEIIHSDLGIYCIFHICLIFFVSHLTFRHTFMYLS